MLHRDPLAPKHSAAVCEVFLDISHISLHFLTGRGACWKTLVKHGIITATSPRSIKGPFQKHSFYIRSPSAVSITTMKGWKDVLYNLQDSIPAIKTLTQQLHTCTYTYASVSCQQTHPPGLLKSVKKHTHTHTPNYAQTTVWHICKNAVAQWSGQENKKDRGANLQIILFILIDNQSCGSVQTGYPIRHLRTTSLPPNPQSLIPLAHKHTRWSNSHRCSYYAWHSGGNWLSAYHQNRFSSGCRW